MRIFSIIHKIENSHNVILQISRRPTSLNLVRHIPQWERFSRGQTTASHAAMCRRLNWTLAVVLCISKHGSRRQYSDNFQHTNICGDFFTNLSGRTLRRFQLHHHWHHGGRHYFCRKTAFALWRWQCRRCYKEELRKLLFGSHRCTFLGYFHSKCNDSYSDAARTPSLGGDM